MKSSSEIAAPPNISLPISLCLVLDALVILNRLTGVHGVLGLCSLQFLVLSGHTHTHT